MRSSKPQSGSPLAVFQVRVKWVAFVLFCCATTLVGRLAYLQVKQHDALWEQSERQYVESVKIFTGRGEIYDRNHNLLATNLEVESVYLNPREVDEPDKAVKVLSETLDIPQKDIRGKVDSSRRFVWVKRKVSLDKIERLKAEDLSGVGFVGESRRFYPKREMAATTLGFVGTDNQGLSGIEHYYESILKGTERKKFVERDARGRRLLTTEGDPLEPRKSQDVVLTIDEVIQFIAEKELADQVENFGAKSGLAVVMDPYNGEIFAIANYPQFNPNQFWAYPSSAWRNIAVSHAYEPGSIFKPVVAAASIEAGVASPDDIFFCENGNYKLGKASIGEAANHRFGWLSLASIIIKSSNIGSIKIADKLGKQKFYDYIRRFGFGEKTGIDLPGEGRGKVRGLEDWSGLSLASISFGHEISTTPIQMTAAIGAIANGGHLVKPQITRALMKDGEVIKGFQPKRVRRVISEKTSRQMIDILKAVVKEGTGTRAAVPGFSVAGKTGTAQKSIRKPAGIRRQATSLLLSGLFLQTRRVWPFW